ncbi:MAG: DUF2797 domain-containing protein [Pseudohongiellaceae bacterium]
MQSIGKGTLRKMHARMAAPVSYTMPLGEQRVPLNELLEQKLQLQYSGEIHCIHCGRQTKKSFNQGYCYPCFQTLAQCDSCIIHPEKCHHHLGSCRQPEWGDEFCMQDHIVYLANSSGLKVGITRATQVPTRWIDQGAVQALAIMRVRTRYQSGCIEVMLKQHVADKTNWRDMLRGGNEPMDLPAEKARLLEACKNELRELENQLGFFAVSVLNGVAPIEIDYPVVTFPEKVASFNLDKEPQVEGVLLGIKGQYLIFDSGVINLRRYAGYHIELSQG